jgi:hypothetical protein
MHTELTAGKTVHITGYCTHAFILRGKPLTELESVLGYGRGRLAMGAAILYLEEVPVPEDFRLAGYTYFSDGTVRGHETPSEERGPNRMESLLKSENGWTDERLRLHKQSMIGTKIVISGHERLAKLVPQSPGDDYPPGSGVFQVEIVRPLRFRVKANITPGQMWLGDYT